MTMFYIFFIVVTCLVYMNNNVIGANQLDSSLLINTTHGLVLGHLNEVGIREWKGIPYAKPPVGQLRWEYPSRPDTYSNIYEANFNAAGVVFQNFYFYKFYNLKGCPQTCNLPPGNCPAYGTSEDCLYLSVFSPTNSSSSSNGYPVFFWIHGILFKLIN